MRRAGTLRRAERIATAALVARECSSLRRLVGHVVVYCANPKCPCREVDVAVREYEAPLPAHLRCPACRHLLKLHYVQTRGERADADEARARRSVAAQLDARRHPGEAIPLTVDVSLDALIARVVADEARGA